MFVKKRVLVIGDDLKAQQPREMWAGAGVVQPSVTPAASSFHMAERVRPGVALLSLFCSCYLFTETVGRDEEGDSFASRARGRQGVSGGEVFLETTWHRCAFRHRVGPASGQRESGAGAICGTDMVDVPQLVCFCPKRCQIVMAPGLFSSQPDPHLVTRLFTPILHERIRSSVISAQSRKRDAHN